METLPVMVVPLFWVVYLRRDLHGAVMRIKNAYI